MAKTTKLKDLIPDNKNFNKGTEYGNSLIEKSLRKFGSGRSILIDKNNRIIAGNKTVENAAAIGLEDLQIVESDGTKIIAVKRTDIDLDSKEGRELALADNATAKANIDWDIETTFEVANEFGFDAGEWGIKDGGFEVDADKLGEDFTLPDGDKAPFQQMTFTLADEQAEQIKNAISDIKETQEYKYAETMGNENSNGNALYLIIMQWAEQRK
jgi:sporulation protein YlmC with PRC-barrel domain